MFARQTYFTVPPEKIKEMRKIYEKEIIPEVKAQKGFVNIFLLEPTGKTDEFISLTLWQKETDAEKYEKSGKYQELVGKLKPVLTKPTTTLKSFEVQKMFQ